MTTGDAVLRRVSMVIRVSGLAQLWFAMAWVWPRYPRPMWAISLALVLTGATAVSLWLERKAGSPTRATLLIDFPAGLLALAGCAYLVPTQQYAGWAYFAYPYTILQSAAFGLAHRLPVSIGAGSLWGGCYLATRAWRDEPANPLEAIAYLIYPPVTWLLVGLLKRTTTETAHTTTALADQARLTAAAREQTRQARLLHNNVLQTLETLIRTDAVSNPDTRKRLADDAAWLRDIVSTVPDPVTEQLRQGLLLAISPAHQAGLEVRVVDAALRQSSPRQQIDPQAAGTVVALVHEIIAIAVANTEPGTQLVLRVEPEPDGLQLSAVFPEGLSTQAVTALNDHTRQITASGDGVVEAWVPNGGVSRG